jgi:hypothetical protein
MSAECEYDVPAFVEMVRTGVVPADVTHTVTREEGSLVEEPQTAPVTDAERVDVSRSDR